MKIHRASCLPVLLLLAAVSPAAIRAAPAEDPLFLVDAEGSVDTLAQWQALVAEEFELLPARDGESPARRPVSSPVSVSFILYDGVLIPISKIAFILPGSGIIRFRDGHEIHARPLRDCALSRTHNYIDLERQGMTLATSASGAGIDKLEPREVQLEVSVEFVQTREVAGFEKKDVGRRSITDAAAVVFDRDALQPARQALARR